MKTKDLIKKLQEADPSGELECAIGGNVDIWEVYETPAYYDGCLEILKRDHTKDPYYNICGGIITGLGQKINIRPMSIEDAMLDDPDMPVDVVGYSPESKERIEKQVEKWRKETKDIIEEVRKKRKGS